MSITIQNHGQARDLNCTDGESKIYDQIVKALSDAGIDVSCMELIRKSDDYVSACMYSGSDYGHMDVARFKFTDRAKWIKTGSSFEKFKITRPEDVLELSEELVAAYRLNEPYL